jgi:hypothetical protein
MKQNTEAITSYEIFDAIRVSLGKFQFLDLFLSYSQSICF